MGTFEAVAEHWLEVPPRGGWEMVFEVPRGGERRPLLLRTNASRSERVILCALELERGDPDHMALLENMIAFCALGRLDVVTVVGDSSAGYEAVGAPDRTLTEKLRLQGAHVVELGVPPGTPLPFRRWPLRGARYVVLPPDQPPGEVAREPEAADWLRRGGTLVSTEGETCIWRPGATDVGWVLARWGPWFAGTDATAHRDGDGWLEHIHRARAVLRTLHAFTGPGAPAIGLGLPAIARFRGPVETLLRARVGERGDCSEIISTTTAAVDLDAMFGGGLLPDRRRTEAWLRTRAARSTLDDRLDIARCLRDPALLREAAGELGSRRSRP